MTRDALEYVPKPPVHWPAPLAIAVRLIDDAPQISYSPPASAVDVSITSTGWSTVMEGQGPAAPSGSDVVQTSVKFALATSLGPGV